MERETAEVECEADEGDREITRWSLFGLGATVSLCCLFTAPAATAAAGAAAGGGAAAAAGGGLVSVFVSALTVGLLLVAIRLRTGSPDCERGQ